MEGLVDIEASVLVDKPHGGEGNIVPGEIPADRDATLTSRDHSMGANKPLFAWTEEYGIKLDRDEIPAGLRYACRSSSRSRTYDLSHEDKVAVQLNFLCARRRIGE